MTVMNEAKKVSSDIKRDVTKDLKKYKKEPDALKYIMSWIDDPKVKKEHDKNYIDTYAQEFISQLYDGVKKGAISESLESEAEEVDQLCEAIVKRVDSRGQISRVLDRKTRRRRATQTTGLSKSKRRLIARKAVRTKKKDQAGQRKALKRRKRTLRKRKALGL